MAELGTITIDGLEVTTTNTDPVSVGVSKAIGSLVLYSDGTSTGFFQKTGSLNTDWRKMSLNPVGGFVSGRIPYGSSGDLIVTATTLFWDSTNSRLGISTEAPDGKIHARQTVSADPILVLQQPSSPTGNIIAIRDNLNTDVFNITANGYIRFPNGVVGNPTYSFFSETNTGHYLSAAGVLSAAVGGVLRLSISATDIASTVVFTSPDGSVSVPGYRFASSANTGLYSSGAGIINFATTGSERFRIDTSGIATILGGVFRLGSATYFEISTAAPAANRIYSITDVGANANFILSQGAQTLSGVKTFNSGVPITATTNQLVLGTTNTITITAPAPAASRVYTIPDVLTAASFIMSQGVQTLAGVKTFSSGVLVTATTNQFVLGTTNTVTISSTAPAASRVYTIPDVLAAADFIMSQGSQTLSGIKTFSSGIPVTATTNQLVLGTTNTVTITSPAPAASRVYTIPDVLASASFVMSEGNQTLNGTKTFSALPIFSTLTQNNVPFGGASGQISQSANFTWNNGTNRLSATNGTLFSSNGFIMGADLSLIPVVGGQSVMTAYWGIQLVGNKQGAIEYTPTNVGIPEIASVIIPNQQDAGIGLLIRATAAQSADIFDIQDAGGNSWVSVSNAGLLIADNAMRLGTTTNATNGNLRFNGLGVEFYRDTWRSLEFPKMEFDDFHWTAVGTTQPFAWVSTTANGGTAAFNTTVLNNSLGVANIATGTTNNTTGVSALQSSNGTSTISLTGLPLTMEWRVRLATLSTAGVNYVLRVGLQDSAAAGDPTNGVYFSYNHGVNSGQWQGITRNASTSTTVNSSIAVVAGTWYRLRAEVVLTPSLAVNFYISTGGDYTFIGSSSTNITTNSLRLVAKINKQTTTTATSSTANIDYVMISMER